MNWIINRDGSHCMLVMIMSFINLVRLQFFFWTETHVNVSLKHPVYWCALPHTSSWREKSSLTFITQQILMFCLLTTSA